MDQLVYVETTLYISTSNASLPITSWDSYRLEPNTSSIDIQLPSLIEASEIALWGNIARHAPFPALFLARLILAQSTHA
jgi:hypothetical protein